ncbi:MAG: UDP-N-acetylmuramate--L-alanine ligase [Saprospiraceae bacterium]|nr:UDP-N-acetylmuramate--L-alanine ligase [Saprospiraceae bacterium]
MLDQLKKIYFLGIGGIGMSALARYFNKRGIFIYGYDKTETVLTKQLILEGMQIHYTDDMTLISADIDLVVMTPAIPKSMNIYKHFIKLGTPVKKRSQVLGEITSVVKNIAVAGTHGKTTTSSILAHVLIDSKMPVSAFLGGITKNYNSNYIDIGNEWMIEEADEYDRSFLQLYPNIAIIGSLDADHLDIYGSRENMVESYVEFASQIQEGGLLLMSDHIQISDLELFKSKLNPSVQLLTYGFKLGTVSCVISNNDNGWINFDYQDDLGNHFKQLKLRMPGNHNIQNATAAIRVAVALGLKEQQIRTALNSFLGIQRRFEWKFEGQHQVLIDDYAHHPEELKAAIEGVRSCYPSRHITGIFQPHLYSRTKDFAQEFAHVLDQLDRIILVELYPAREEPIEDISSATIFDKCTNPNKFLIHKINLVDELKKMELDVLITLGAGDLDTVIPDLIKILK